MSTPFETYLAKIQDDLRGGKATEYTSGAAFIVGIALILVEIFLIPGFGFTGIFGLALVLVSLVGAHGTDPRRYDQKIFFEFLADPRGFLGRTNDPVEPRFFRKTREMQHFLFHAPPDPEFA